MQTSSLFPLQIFAINFYTNRAPKLIAFTYSIQTIPYRLSPLTHLEVNNPVILWDAKQTEEPLLFPLRLRRSRQCAQISAAILSSFLPVVRGAKSPISTITIAIAPATIANIAPAP